MRVALGGYPMLTQSNSKPLSLQYDMRIGVDTSQKSYAVTYKSAEGHHRSMQMASNPEALHLYFQKRFPSKGLLKNNLPIFSRLIWRNRIIPFAVKFMAL
jgi:hypothetical protein